MNTMRFLAAVALVLALSNMAESMFSRSRSSRDPRSHSRSQYSSRQSRPSSKITKSGIERMLRQLQGNMNKGMDALRTILVPGTPTSDTNYGDGSQSHHSNNRQPARQRQRQQRQPQQEEPSEANGWLFGSQEGGETKNAPPPVQQPKQQNTYSSSPMSGSLMSIFGLK
ncbi:uncharacterized protein [Haliotis cracherodii]|uniref:uncharacterized protein n=1 Tax=Haliotis cracherodii TaxID=6455 RepID=UPI0039E7AF8B